MTRSILPSWFRRLLRNHPKAQSLTEFAILLPLLAMMLSGLIEFGIMLNYYLDIIDAARESARFAADVDPIRDSSGNPLDPNPLIYDLIKTEAKQSLYFASDGRIDWRDPAACGVEIQGDIVVSAFSVLGDTIDKRYPSGTGDNGLSMCGTEVSNMSTADINSILSGAAIPNSGLVLVEIYYDYYMVLGLPWIRAFVPDPVTLHAYGIMPNVHVEPTPTS